MASARIQEDEYLEHLWQLQEEGTDEVAALAAAMGDLFNRSTLDKLAANGLVRLSKEGARVELTEQGLPRAQQVIRAHRLGERLIHDAFGSDFEEGACEFEHTVTDELVDAICTLLGHPRECPHGLPIPEGDCCRRVEKMVTSPAVSLTDLEVGQSGRVVYVRCGDDDLMHKIDGLHIRPGSLVRLHQKYPTFVIECEGANIALSEEVAGAICVWKARPGSGAAKGGDAPAPRPRGWLRCFRPRSGEPA